MLLPQGHIGVPCFAIEHLNLITRRQKCNLLAVWRIQRLKTFGLCRIDFLVFDFGSGEEILFTLVGQRCFVQLPLAVAFACVQQCPTILVERNATFLLRRISNPNRRAKIPADDEHFPTRNDRDFLAVRRHREFGNVLQRLRFVVVRLGIRLKADFKLLRIFAHFLREQQAMLRVAKQAIVRDRQVSNRMSIKF